MNQIACVMLDNNLFIINDSSDQKMSNARLKHLVSMCIKFNELIYEDVLNITYRGIIQFKTIQNIFKQNKYIIVTVNIKKNTVHSATMKLSKMKLTGTGAGAGTGTDDGADDGTGAGADANIMDYLNSGIIDLYQNHLIECYNSSYNGKTYDYTQNSKLQIDLDIIYNTFLDIKDDPPIDNITFSISL
jgi:hypothetical protein